MFNFIETLFTRGLFEIEKMRRALVSVIIATIVGVTIILLVKPSLGVFPLLILIPWAYSAWRIFFDIKKFLKAHVAGEVFEAIGAAFAKISIATPTSQTSIFSNPFISWYWDVIRNMFLIQTSLFLLAPIYVNFTVGGISVAIMIAMIVSVIALDSPHFFYAFARKVVAVMVFFYVIALSFHLNPSLKFYAGVGSITERIPSYSNVRDFDSVDDLRKRQREQILSGIAMDKYRWQQMHPGEDPPKEFDELIRKAGGNASMLDFFKRMWSSKI